jgi:hypothetical protein
MATIPRFRVLCERWDHVGLRLRTIESTSGVGRRYSMSPGASAFPCGGKACQAGERKSLRMECGSTLTMGGFHRVLDFHSSDE